MNPFLVVIDQDYWSSAACKDPSILDKAAVLMTLNSSAIGVPVERTFSDQAVVSAILICDSHDTITFSFTAVLMNGDDHLSGDVC